MYKYTSLKQAPRRQILNNCASMRSSNFITTMGTVVEQ